MSKQNIPDVNVKVTKPSPNKKINEARAKNETNKKEKPKKPGKDFSLIKAIRAEKTYKSNVIRRDIANRKYIKEHAEDGGPNDAIPGQLISFNYYEPKTEEELEYYDAMPVTIFFGRFKVKDGMRIIGFNIHYYPPRIRYQVMNRIFDIWKPMYLKSWDKSLSSGMSNFDYKWLMEQLESTGLSFGVRMYVPGLIAGVKVIPPCDYSKAVLTEGKFRKRTRDAILNYWAQYCIKKKYRTKKQSTTGMFSRKSKKKS